MPTWPWSRPSQPAAPVPQQAHPVLDTPLLRLSELDTWSVRDACEGTQVFGGTGSGKTSGSGYALATAFLEAGMGGLILCAKPDEPAYWQRLAGETGRAEDLVLIEAGGPWRFNFLAHEASRSGGGGGITENLVGLFDLALESGTARQGHANQDSYWRDARKQLLRNAIDLVLLSGEELTLPLLLSVIRSAPSTPDSVGDPEWRAASKCAQLLIGIKEEGLSEDSAAEFHLTVEYWLQEFPGLAEKTRSVVVNSFTAMADGLLRGPLRALFSTSTSITPEATFEGKLIVLALPEKLFKQAGVRAQVIFKLLWQQAMERRPIRQATAPCFLWADEAQFFVTEEDASFQTTARSARACTVYLTQNLPNYYRYLGDKHSADALIGNLQTKIFHANQCVTTNQWAADTLGKAWQTQVSASSSHTSRDAEKGGKRSDHNSSSSASQQLNHQLEPLAFQRLRRGGPAAGCLVDAVVTQTGRWFEATRVNHITVCFEQPQ